MISQREIYADWLFWVALLIAPLSLWFIKQWVFINQIDLTIKILLLSVLIHPLLEEIIFRSNLQKVLLRHTFFSKKIYFISYANLMISIIFTCLHLFYRPSIFTLLIIFPSLVFGFFYDRYNSIKPSFLLHSTYNGFLLLFSSY